MPRRLLASRMPFLLAVAGVCLAIAGYIFGMAWIQSLGNPYYTPSDLIIPRTIDVVVVFWCVWVASSVGSFLNVVAWRMPRGQSVGGRSHCPRCMSQLRARDNFPVFGWLALGGRCHTCRLPISPRYPIVEGAVGISLGSIAVAQIYCLSLPGQPLHWHGGPLWAPRITTPILLAMVFHVAATAWTWAFGLVRFDKHRLPTTLFASGIGLVVAVLLVFPPFAMVTWRTGQAAEEPWAELAGGSIFIDAVVRVLTAIVAAALVGRSLARGLCPAADLKQDPLGKSTARLVDLILILMIPTLLVGWQSSPALVVVASLIAVPIRRVFSDQTDSLGSFAIAMPIALTLHLMLWRWLLSVPWWPGPTSDPWVILGWAGLILLVPVWLREPDAMMTRPLPPPWVDPDEEEDEEEDNDEEEEDEDREPTQSAATP